MFVVRVNIFGMMGADQSCDTLVSPNQKSGMLHRLQYQLSLVVTWNMTYGCSGPDGICDAGLPKACWHF